MHCFFFKKSITDRISPYIPCNLKLFAIIDEFKTQRNDLKNYNHKNFVLQSYITSKRFALISTKNISKDNNCPSFYEVESLFKIH